MNPIQIIDGAWSRRSVPKKAVRTGSFSFTIAGDIPFQGIDRYTPYFVKVLLKGVFVPGEKWTFAHAIGVPTKDSNSVLWDCEALTAEVQRNPVFADIILCTQVHWCGNVTTVAGKSSVAGIIVFVNKSWEGRPGAPHEGSLNVWSPDAMRHLRGVPPIQAMWALSRCSPPPKSADWR